MSPIITGVRFKMFTSNGTFVVPEGVTKIYVTGCGGGGGGGATSPNGSSGGSTSLGSLLTLSGGLGNGSSGGFGGQNGTRDVGPTRGGSTLFGVGGQSSNGSSESSGSGYGAGGSSEDLSSSGYTGQAGGGAQCCLKQEISTTPGTSHSVTIGGGGAGANLGGSWGVQASGSSGFLLIEW